MEYNTNPFLSVVQFKQITINITLTETSCMLLLPRYTSLWSMFLYLFLFQPTEEATVASTVINRKTALITKTEKETLPFQNPQISHILLLAMEDAIFLTLSDWSWTRVCGNFCTGDVCTTEISDWAFWKARTKPTKKKAKKTLPLLQPQAPSWSPGSAAWTNFQWKSWLCCLK